LSFLEIFPRNVFCALPLPCLRGLKCLMSATTAALHPFPVVTNLLLAGKSFSEGLFGDLHRQLLFTSPNVLHRPPLKPKNCDGWLVHAPGATTLKVSSGDEVATRWLPSSLARSSPASHAGSKGSNILQHRPFRFRCKPAPLSPPRELNTPLECCESCAGQYPHLPTVSRTMRTSQFPKIAKFLIVSHELVV